MSVSLKKILPILPFFFAVLISIFFFFYITPTELINFIGIKNAYILMYVIALLGGMTTFNTVPYIPLLLLLASAGVNPLLLGLSSAFGVITGDAFSYFIGKQGAAIFPQKIRTLFMSIKNFAQKHPKLFPVICFLYGSISPLSNDFISIPAGMARISYIRVMIPLALGNMVFNIGLVYASLYAYSTVSSIFGA